MPCPVAFSPPFPKGGPGGICPIAPAIHTKIQDNFKYFNTYKNSRPARNGNGRRTPREAPLYRSTIFSFPPSLSLSTPARIERWQADGSFS